jgi:hypothetical protein
MTKARDLSQVPNASLGFKNRLINGDMRIDQRNAGASVTVNALAQIFSVDRWYGAGQATDGVFTLQQSTDSPEGFNNSLKATVTTADASVGASQLYVLQHRIEGFNVADLGWGTANAKTVTLSFQVKSSVTGTFGARLANSSSNRSYPFSYTINSANTWETKSVTIVGDTAGTWVTNNGIGIGIIFSFGVGSTYQGTANAWAAADYIAPTGSVNIISTSGATFYITGVQLEKGSTATSFDYRPYGTELALCQRYFQNITAAIGHVSGAGNGVWRSTSYLPVSMRANPTLSIVGSPSYLIAASTSANLTSIGSNYSTQTIAQFDGGFSSTPGSNGYPATLTTSGSNYLTASSEL